VILKPLKGTIFDLRGSVKVKERPVDFKKLRETVKKEVAKRVVEEMK